MVSVGKTMTDEPIDLLAPWPSADCSATSDRISERDLASEWGITTRRVQQLVADRVITRVGRGKDAFDRREATRAYISWLSGKASRGVAVQDDLKEARTTLAKAQIQKVELANDVARGELVAASEVAATWSGILRDVRASMLAVSSRCGATLPHLTSHDVATIDGEIKAALEALADGR